MKRIYDAEFESNGTEHHHLARFWWVEGSDKGTWARLEAYNYVSANPETVYVSEDDATVYVYPYYFVNKPDIKWIQTEADGIKRDNLITLAGRHAQGLPNS